MSSEDARYRTSTQYRHWSYTPSALRSLRESTNALATTQVRDAVRRAREARAASSNDNSEAENSRSASTALPDGDVDCLTVDEELKLLDYYCRQTLQLGDHLGVPIEVKATAIQYIRRFYISHSLMTYTPTTILKTALFFATKTENHYFRITRFASDIGKTTTEEILSSEFLLTQGLRFQFDIRHPYRGLEGAVMELLAISTHKISIPAELESQRPENMHNLILESHGHARHYLKTSALLCDSYFHYTPSQIMFASLYLASAPLTTFYLALKFYNPSNPDTNTATSTYQKLLTLIKNLAQILSSIPEEQTPEQRQEIQALVKKLKKCRNPEKADLVGLQKMKREGVEGKDGEDDEKIIKKRKMEREQRLKEEHDLFGGSLK
ncbi:putative cyclin ccl1 protein [Botrytis fragariae]|uniref:RNA polymerase II holoenzyme cyclin-like subunit n=1 Tax=Botrytis fragariae TaxID=1964551 RepID=A0A8H6EIX1_9HELO|nr:putative cyclin ccl1 protein [Botrytis fragariae]KAF5873570.1 putative cyclin ccl1 protein [Botrytis fragariae]